MSDCIRAETSCVEVTMRRHGKEDTHVHLHSNHEAQVVFQDIINSLSSKADDG